MQRLWLVALAALSVAATEPAKAQISDDVVKIGVLTDMSGPSSTATVRVRWPPRKWQSTISAARFWASRSRDFRRSSDQARHCRRHRAAMVRPRPSRPDRRRAGLGRRPCGAERRQREARSCSSPIRPARPISTANSARPTPCSGCSTRTRLRSAPRRKSTKRGGKTWFFLTADYAFGHALERDASAGDRAERRQGGGLGARIRSRRPICRRSFCRRRPRKRKSSGSPAARPTTSMRSSSAASSASSRAASRWPAFWC